MMPFLDIAHILNERYPEYPLPTKLLPKWVAYIGSWFVKDLAALYPMWGVKVGIDNEATMKDLELKLRDVKSSIHEMVAVSYTHLTLPTILLV